MTETKKNITAAPDSNSADVVIDGKVLTLTGSDPGYLQQVAKYIDETIAGMKREKILSRKSAEHRAMMVYLKLADDCLKARAALAEKNEEMSSREGDVYTLKRELVEKRVEAEKSREQLAAEKDRQKNARADLMKELEDRKQELEALKKELETKTQESETMTQELETLRAEKASLEEALKASEESLNASEAALKAAEESLKAAEEARAVAEQNAAKFEADLNELLGK